MAEYEILEHTADIGFRAWGPSPSELFRNAARAMMAIAMDPETLSGLEERQLETRGADYPDLMVNWLSEVLYLFDTNQFASRDFRVDYIAADRMRATLIGEPREPERHPWELIIKAVTYHQLKVEQQNRRWKAEVFLDI